MSLVLIMSMQDAKKEFETNLRQIQEDNEKENCQRLSLAEDVRTPFTDLI